MKGNLIVIDGLDGSGKATQTKILHEYFQKRDISCKLITFPDYKSPSSALVKMYLQGDIHKNPEMVNAYAASCFYAADRYISYTKSWGADYQNGVTILADRYVSSNLIHQMVKLPPAEWDTFIRWLYDFEFHRLGLPAPDKVLYLDMPLEISQQLLSHRYDGDQSQKDIHEKNRLYLKRCREAALYAANTLHWTVISCGNEDTLQPYPIENIAELVLKQAQEFLNR